MNHPRLPSSLLFLTGLGLFLGACGGSSHGHKGDGYGGEGQQLGDIGAPCELEEHCEADLICDVHGERGSCQKPHGH